MGQERGGEEGEVRRRDERGEAGLGGEAVEVATARLHPSPASLPHPLQPRPRPCEALQRLACILLSGFETNR